MTLNVFRGSCGPRDRRGYESQAGASWQKAKAWQPKTWQLESSKKEQRKEEEKGNEMGDTELLRSAKVLYSALADFIEALQNTMAEKPEVPLIIPVDIQEAGPAVSANPDHPELFD